jgi:hypothetical protein
MARGGVTERFQDGTTRYHHEFYNEDVQYRDRIDVRDDSGKLIRVFYNFDLNEVVSLWRYSCTPVTITADCGFTRRVHYGH